MSETPSGGTKRPLQNDTDNSKPAKRRKEETFKTADSKAVTEEEVFHDSSWLYMDCSYCNMHMKELLTSHFHGEKLVLQMHAQYSVFSKSSRGDSASKEDVRIFKDEFLQKVCGLRNERGGMLVIHVTGKSADKGPSLDDFDQKVGEELSRMVEDDTLFVENYDRRWFSHHHTFKDEQEKEHRQMVYLDYIIVNVKGSSSVSTKDFNTLVTWDGSKERPKAREISRLLWRTSLQPCFRMDKSTNCDFKEGDRIDLYESRDIQLKRLYDKDLEKDLQDHPFLADKSLAYRIAFRLKEKLHLLEYITSFTKLRTGGAFYCGIEEEKQKVVVVTEKSKSSKKNKKKKRKGQGTKLESEDDKDEHCDTGENVLPTEAKMSEKENAETISKNLNVIRDDLKFDLTDSIKREKSSSKSDSVTNQTKENQAQSPNTASVSSVQIHPSSQDSKDTQGSIVASNSQTQMAQNVVSHIKQISSEFEIENNNMGNGNKVTAPKPDPSGHSASFKLDVQSQSVVCDMKTDVCVISESKDYKTAHNMVKGFKLTEQDRNELQVEILASLQKDMLWLRTDGTKLTADEISNEVEVQFHCTSEENETFVTEVWVPKVFSGIAFYKSYGPDAFRLAGLLEKKPRVIRMDPSEWIRLLRKAMQCDNCDRPIWKLQLDADVGHY